MNSRALAILSLALVAAPFSAWLLLAAGDSSAAIGSIRVFVPGIAADSVPAAAAPTLTPTPTPIGGPGATPASGDLRIFISLDIIGIEPTADGDGRVEIPMFASADSPFPPPGGQEVTSNGAVTIALHPTDAAGCTWDRTYAAADFTMTVQPPAPGSNSVLLQFVAPEWHYTVTCPTSPPVVLRAPAFGEAQMLAFVGYTFPEFGPPTGAPIDVPLVSVVPTCIKRETQLHRTHELADVTVRIVIYQPPCPIL